MALFFHYFWIALQTALQFLTVTAFVILVTEAFHLLIVSRHFPAVVQAHPHLSRIAKVVISLPLFLFAFSDERIIWGIGVTLLVLVVLVWLLFNRGHWRPMNRRKSGALCLFLTPA